MNSTVHAIAKNWQPLAPLLSAPYTEEDYHNRLDLLNQLIDEVGGNEQHPLASLLDTVGILVANYEQEHYPLPEASPQEVLAYLLKEHQLTQSELPEIGSQGVVSEILRGKRHTINDKFKHYQNALALHLMCFFDSWFYKMGLNVTAPLIDH